MVEINNYYVKYLKYKNKYLELKQKLAGGNDGLKIMYSNVGVDAGERYTAFCNVFYNDKSVPEWTFINLQHVLEKMLEKDIDILVFIEFCFSELRTLIEYMNQDVRFQNYGLVLLAQKRDNTNYKPVSKDGKHMAGDVELDGYHPDVTRGDGYFKCFGYIYKKDKLIFNKEKTREEIGLVSVIQELTAINQKDIYRNGMPIGDASFPVNRPVHILKIYDFSLSLDDYPGQKISRNILQYSGLAIFNTTPIGEAAPSQQLSAFLVPHFYKTRFQEDLWFPQFFNINEKIVQLKSQDIKSYMIGDFNVRGFLKQWSTPPTNRLLDMKGKFTEYAESIREVKGENTLYKNIVVDDVIDQYKYQGTNISYHKIVHGITTISVPPVVRIVNPPTQSQKQSEPYRPPILRQDVSGDTSSSLRVKAPLLENKRGYDNGYHHGYDDGYNRRKYMISKTLRDERPLSEYEKGYEQGYEQGYERGYRNEYQKGYDRGYSDAVNNVPSILLETDNWRDKRLSVYEQGYQKGYQERYRQGTEKRSRRGYGSGYGRRDR